jgi:carbon storage regulator
MEEFAMLVLSRKLGERIIVGDDLVITINRIANNRVSLGIEAPAETRILRGELELDAVASPAVLPCRSLDNSISCCAG